MPFSEEAHSRPRRPGPVRARRHSGGRLREAGAIVLAKTNMAEWAFSPRESVSSSFDTTRNAYDLERVPAGSSGGTASGVAASFGLIGLGSDTGNSIRGPSSHLSLVGIRSTIVEDLYVILAEVEDIDGIPTVVESKVTDLEAGSHTISKFSKVEYNGGLKDKIFTERSLRKVPREAKR